MKKAVFYAVVVSLVVGCEGAEIKEKKRLEALAKLTCQSSRENRTKEELQAIGDACFRGGSYTKSRGMKW